MDMASVVELQANHQAAVNLFNNQCPAEARVSSVVGIRGRGKEKCAWRVLYTRNMAPEFINITPDELVRRIRINHPNNTRIIKEYCIPYPPAVEMVYSVYCGCGESVHAGMTIKKSVSVETINEDFVTLKVEENT